MAFARKKRLLQFSVLILAAAAAVGLLHQHYAPRAFGQCTSACLAQHQCDLDFSHPHEMHGDCLIIQNQCSAQCGGGDALAQPVAHQAINPAAIAVGGAYGAIAYDKDSGAWGLSDFAPNQDSAGRSALGFCGTYGPHCVIVASFSNICAAVATGGKNTVAWAKDPDRDTAQKDAVSNCAKKTKASCSLRRSNCYSP
jgi:Domain of unknown function (DUF4189)